MQFTPADPQSDKNYASLWALQPYEECHVTAQWALQNGRRRQSLRRIDVVRSKMGSPL